MEHLTPANDDACDCPITFVEYAVAGDAAPVLVCASGVRGHTVSRAAIRQIIAAAHSQGRAPACPFCMQALVSQDVCQLEIDYIVIDRLIARERGTMADASAHRDRLTTQARVTEALPVALSRAVCGAGLSQFVRGVTEPPLCAGAVLIKSQPQPRSPVDMASHMEQLHHAAATADEHAQHCVVPLLGIAPYGGGGGSADSTCAVLLYPDRTVGDLVRSEASAQRAGLNLPVWLHVGLATARCLRVLEARGFPSFMFSPDTLSLPAAEPLDPARCVDCVPPKGGSAEGADGAWCETQFALYRRPGAAGAAADIDDPCDTAACVAATGVLGWALTMLHAWLGRSPFVGMSLADVSARARDGVLAEYLQPLIDASDLDLSLRDLLKECVCDSAAKRPTARNLHNQLKTLAPLLVPPLILFEEARRATGLPVLGGPPADPLEAAPHQPHNQPVFVAIPVAAVGAMPPPPQGGGQVPADAPPAEQGGPPAVAGNHAAACGSPRWWRKFCVRVCIFVVIAIVLRWVLATVAG